MQIANRPQPANHTILLKILQNLRQSFFRTHCVTLTETMRLVIQCKVLNTIRLPGPPIELGKHWNIIRQPAGYKSARASLLAPWTRLDDGAGRGRPSARRGAGRCAPRHPRAPRRSRHHQAIPLKLWQYAQNLPKYLRKTLHTLSFDHRNYSQVPTTSRSVVIANFVEASRGGDARRCEEGNQRQRIRRWISLCARGRRRHSTWCT